MKGSDHGDGRDTAQTRVTASFLRTYIEWLRTRGLLARVVEGVAPDVRRVLVSPPPPRSWVPGTVIEAMDASVESVAGLPALRELAAAVTRASILPPAVPAMRAILDLFGATPHSLYARLPLLAQHASRGIEYEYLRLADRACEVRVRYVGRPDVPWRTFVAFAGVLGVAFDLCTVRGEVGEPERVIEPGCTVARYCIAW